MAFGETYEEFVEKFEPKKTTDDCYTPVAIYEAVKSWVVEEYNLPERKIVRPFYPGGDYENYEYPENCVVIDNPPFSILSRIESFYCENNIDFFLFAPALTLFSSGYKNLPITYITTGAAIIYENKANVSTSFVTNLNGDIAIRTAPSLRKEIEDAQEQQKEINIRKLPKYSYPPELLTGAIMNKLSNLNINFSVRKSECLFTRQLDEQKKIKKTIFGAGFLISENKATEKREAENKATEKREAENKATEKERETLIWQLSKSEREKIAALGD